MRQRRRVSERPASPSFVAARSVVLVLLLELRYSSAVSVIVLPSRTMSIGTSRFSGVSSRHGPRQVAPALDGLAVISRDDVARLEARPAGRESLLTEPTSAPVVPGRPKLVARSFVTGWIDTPSQPRAT